MSAQPFEVRMAGLEGSYRQVSDRLNSIDRRLDGFEQKMESRFNGLDQKIEARFSGVEARFSGVDSRFASMDLKIDGLQWRMTALILGSWITLMAAILLRH